MNFLERFLKGFSAPWKGLKFLAATKSLWIWALVPWSISVLIMALGLNYFIFQVPTFLGPWLPAISGFFTGALYYTALSLAILFSVLILLVLVVVATKLIAVPFNALLAEKTLSLLGQPVPSPSSLSGWIKDSIRLFRISFLKSIVFLTLSFILLFLALIPGVQVVAGAIGLTLAACDCADYSCEALRMSFGSRMKFFQKFLPEFFGFGATLGLIFLVPLLNTFFFPSAIVGGAILISEFKNSGKLP